MDGQNVKEEPCLRTVATKRKTQAKSSAKSDRSQWFRSHIPADGLNQIRNKTRLSHVHASFSHDLVVRNVKI